MAIQRTAIPTPYVRYRPLRPTPLVPVYLGDRTGAKGFDGGLNLRDAFSEIAANESPLCRNVNFDERGGACSRLGYLKLNGASLLPASPCFVYESKNASALIAYISSNAGNAQLWKSTDGGVTWASFYTSLTVGSTGAIVDFGSGVVVVSSLDGVYLFPANLGAPTHTAGGANNMDEARGNSLAVWHGKIWVTGDPREDATHSRARVWASNLGDATKWTVATDYVDLRDVNTFACVAIGAGQGLDFQSKGGLLVWKRKGLFRINSSDATAGFTYTTMSADAGAAGPLAVASNLSAIVGINEHGLWKTDGVTEPVRVSDNLAPLFTKDGVDLIDANVAKWSLGTYKDRFVASLRRTGGSNNALGVEYHPTVGWLTLHDLPFGPMVRYTNGTDKLLACSAVDGRVFEAFRGGTDDGAAIATQFQTSFVELMGGANARVRYIRPYGRGVVTMYAITDFSLSGGIQYTANFPIGAGGFQWDVSKWDIGPWGSTSSETQIQIPSDVFGHHLSLNFSANTTTTALGPNLAGDGIAPETGAWAVYGVRVDIIPVLGIGLG